MYKVAQNKVQLQDFENNARELPVPSQQGAVKPVQREGTVK
jgi:hypothetical protein